MPLSFILLIIASYQWSCPAHMIVWEVAMNELGESYVNNVVKPIIEDPTSGNKVYTNLYEYACWADDIKTSATEAWHYYDQPYFVDFFKEIVLPATNNVAWCINVAKDTLLGKSTGYGKSTMIRNLIHMMGDAHQPLHCESLYSTKFPNGDRGGNSFLIKGNDKNLHALWDHCLDKVQSYARPLSITSMDDINAKAKQFGNEYPRSSFISQLNIKDGFAIAADTFNYVADAYIGIEFNSSATAEYKDKEYEVCKKLVALAGYRLTDAIKEVVKLSSNNDLRDD